MIHSHCIEHSDDISGFLRQCGGILKKNGKMIFSLPDMKRLLETNTTSILNFEHTFLLTDEYIRYLLGKEGFEICEVRRFGDGHSIVYDVNYTARKEKGSVINLYVRNKEILQKYFQNQKRMVEAWNKQIEEDHKKIFLFGAHISSQYYVSYGLNISQIEAILDNDPYKIGKYVSGIDKEVISPKELSKYREPKVIIPPSPYASEIKEEILRINENTVFY